MDMARTVPMDARLRFDITLAARAAAERMFENQRRLG
jgi:hypothetical protein